MTLKLLLRLLRSGPMKPLPQGAEKWDAMVRRISEAGFVHEVEDRTFDYFLEVLPPRWLGRGAFAFGEGADRLRVFWNEDNNRFYVRQLDEEENRTFVGLAGIGFSSG